MLEGENFLKFKTLLSERFGRNCVRAPRFTSVWVEPRTTRGSESSETGTEPASLTSSSVCYNKRPLYAFPFLSHFFSTAFFSVRGKRGRGRKQGTWTNRCRWNQFLAVQWRELSKTKIRFIEIYIFCVCLCGTNINDQLSAAVVVFPVTTSFRSNVNIFECWMRRANLFALVQLTCHTTLCHATQRGPELDYPLPSLQFCGAKISNILYWNRNTCYAG